ncbi:MAG: phosphate ABC transporter substrate-binding protein [Pseudobacteriovorax sp.]|nr:phosphate ABC transporter substrate-binding protein [Pseudobacteriovorax sp.]
MRLLALSVLFAFGCINKPNQSNRISVTGSSTVAPLIAEIAKEYESKHPNIRIDVQTGGSSRGILDARQQTSDIGMVSRALKPAENDIKPVLIARDGVGVVVNSSVTIDALSKADLTKLYLKKIQNWSELGGPDLKVTVIHKAQGRSTAEVFLEYLSLQYTNVQADIIIGDNEQAIKNIDSIPGAIGYVSIGAAEYSMKQGSKIKLLELEGIAATTKTVANGTYPISRELNIVLNPKQDKTHVQKFVEYASSAQTNEIVRSLDFVPAKL